MTIIVLGGSRFTTHLSKEIKESIDAIVSKDESIFVGDAPGADSLFQIYLARIKYKNVKIFTSAEKIRNNWGDWNWEHISSGLKGKSNASHAFKDRHMCRLADSGIMIWDCLSAGTLSNIIDLLTQGKQCRIWVTPESKLFEFDNLESSHDWLNSYSEILSEAKSRLSKFTKRELRRNQQNQQFGLFS